MIHGASAASVDTLPASFSLRDEAPTYLKPYVSLPPSLRPCLGQGVSLGEEAVLADVGRAGEVATRVGRVRSLAFVSILLARIIHEDSSRKRADATRDGHSEA